MPDTPLPSTGTPPDSSGCADAVDAADWVLVLRPLPSAIPAAVRMRRLLKCLLRAYHIRCVSVGSGLPTPTPKG